MNSNIICKISGRQSESGIARLFDFLAAIKQYPVSIAAASCVSGMPEKTIAGLLGNTRQLLDYQVLGKYIYLKEQLQGQGGKHATDTYQMG